jgi:hypothetical protein
MITDETDKGNLPTPKADTSLAPTTVQDLVMQLLLSIQRQLEKTDQCLKQTNQRLASIECSECPYDSLWDDATDYNNFCINDADYKQMPTTLGKEPTPIFENKLIHDRNVHWGGSTLNHTNYLKEEMDEGKDEQPLDDILTEIHEDRQAYVEQGRHRLGASCRMAENPIILTNSQTDSSPPPLQKQENHLLFLACQGILSYTVKAGKNKPALPQP